MSASPTPSLTAAPLLTRILVANRGEIACRIMRTAKALGLTTVAVHSATDREARHVREADIGVDLGGSKAADSYLLIDKLIAAAKASGAQAIHPGYGFLSENAGFARAIENAGLIFLGPPASAIDAMGSKSAAKALMEDAGVPLVPGYHGAAQDVDTFRLAAERIGYPVLLKATAGGGGKGMKVVEQVSELAEALASAQREAQSSFGDSRMLVEKYLLKPRHVEIQVFADQHGNCLYLNERDCSIQRRHQKVVEEAPAPGLTPELRRAMGEAAVRAAQTIGYVGAGTVEFLLDSRGEFFFMEMNTRLQVEHPVTEAITGLDLVAWQIRVAQGEPLPITQAQVPLIGHAIEVRLYAEDPANDFLPATGTLAIYRESAAGPGRRVDSGVAEGDSVSPFYDPMLGKLIAWGENREQARLRLLAMLNEFAIGGLKTNVAFLRRIIAHPAFAAAELDTDFIPRYQAQLLPPAGELTAEFWQAAGEAFSQSQANAVRQDDLHSPWSSNRGLRAGLPAEIDLHLSCNSQKQVIQLRNTNASSARLQGEQLVIEHDGVRHQHLAIRRGDTLYLNWQGELHTIKRLDPIAEVEASHTQQGGLTAPMNGSIVRVMVEVGQSVDIGAQLVVLEAMKMEHSVRAPHAGVVKAIYCVEGEMVSEGTALVELEDPSVL
ncbi:acetyl/propionyl/methylcrotonyl-CoA carboxylase subunit alpha [Pseudomonas sp. CCI3.2]|uniref:acetyl/propionyl/methylcrotonyl-CoA carboxylase subunit alpha n=1 Tax=unclassified Pseudomonas TaxID=196821 RepID=UPI002AC8CE5E|nr:MULTISPECIES: acetyl/propionyl/methylcrotonyl-CoA carboxylase subunit alpha [unclassified Pseudomonas]MEB0079547.1 acetyl/propionyl/methylcrotonyl-CoA carboxylase subunit alpha [Pseudomonas sp. MH10out]MEB0091338.1 acetyl/propionyl/methylcrotonyl-CoA carboxylase subunit alpha [Pseudomonas sp. CCI4.2]MEB0101212.1 acetyl/propionyl/methylcrotonyl-CoA carboxylase subunit alpha [Pseudomonas sp. CCI3.2]MEB0131319.1 acetyl/propionyl/methylcrotonyl-CoA carboxylase subunit alpha [Pseudomonas sp. CCI2